MHPSDGSVEPPQSLLPVTWRAAVGQVIGQLGETPLLVVVIRGEPGAGKEWLARLIHAASPRQSGQFVRINCAAPADRLAIELFGHERNAWPGASRRRLGKLEFAHRGTLYLDALGALPPPLHPELLHVLQHRHFTRPGGRERVPVDAQLIAATQQPLTGASTGQCQWDTTPPLKVLDIAVPPLREQREEIPALAAAFLARFNTQYRRCTTLSSDWGALFAEYPWPGNIRELETVVRRLVVGEDPVAIRAELQTRLASWRPPVLQSA